MRRRQSLQILDMETRLDQLVSENRLLQDAKSRAERSLNDATETHEQTTAALHERNATADTWLSQKDEELRHLKEILDKLRDEVTRLTEVNEGYSGQRGLAPELDEQHRDLAAENTTLKSQLDDTTREFGELRTQHTSLSGGMESIVRHEVSLALESKDAELRQLRNELDAAREQVRSLQQQILSSQSTDNIITLRDEDYFDNACQQLCQHVQQWILRFSKFSDLKQCRLISEVSNEEITDRFDNAILDGSDVDIYLADRVKRRDVFMSVVMRMVWEYIFTRYLFGMDREQRQKLKVLEKTLSEVGPPSAVSKWRATTLSLLSKREAFQESRAQDTEAVVDEIFQTLKAFLPPPTHLVPQILDSLRKVMGAAVDLSIEMRTQVAEYSMLPPLKPEYDTNGDLACEVHFNAALMNERSGETESNDELQAQQAVVRMVLFPLVLKREDGEDGEDIVVCPAQVLVARDERPKEREGKRVRVVSAQGGRDERAESVRSFAPSSMDPNMGGMF